MRFAEEVPVPFLKMYRVPADTSGGVRKRPVFARSSAQSAKSCHEKAFCLLPAFYGLIQHPDKPAPLFPRMLLRGIFPPFPIKETEVKFVRPIFAENC